MAMPPPKPKIGVDPARSRDIMDDMVNAVETYVADGFDSFEECLNHEIVEDDGTAAALKAGLDVMYRAAQERIDEHFGRFAEHASSTCFAVPKELLQAQDLAENLPSCSAEEERTLDEQLRDLRKRLAHADAMRSHCDAQSDALEAEMADHASVVEQLRAGKENAVLASVKGGKRGVESAAAAIVAAARQLQPLLEQAEEMQRRGVALSEDVGVMPGGVDAATAARAAMRAHFAKGTSLEVLKSINSRLNARRAAAQVAGAAEGR